jgi:glucan phosphorylase
VILSRQVLVDGFQHEQPDYWLMLGNPWELERLNVTYPISFYGHVSGRWGLGRRGLGWALLLGRCTAAFAAFVHRPSMLSGMAWRAGEDVQVFWA